MKEKFIIEFQMKCGKQMLSANQIQEELLKSVVYMCPDVGYKSTNLGFQTVSLSLSILKIAPNIVRYVHM